MKQYGNYHYYVEGEDDKKIINTLKTDMQQIIPGKVEVFNVIDKFFSKMQIMNLKRGTTVVLVFDTDTGKVENLKKNIAFLSKQSVIKEIICITQIMNLEDELVRSCNIKSIKQLTKSKSDKDFKRDVLRITNLSKRLAECNFDFSSFWAKSPSGSYENFGNGAERVRIKNKK